MLKAQATALVTHFELALVGKGLLEHLPKSFGMLPLSFFRHSCSLLLEIPKTFFLKSLLLFPLLSKKILNGRLTLWLWGPLHNDTCLERAQQSHERKDVSKIPENLHPLGIWYGTLECAKF